MLDALELHHYAREGALLLTPNVRSARQLRVRITDLAADPVEAANLSECILPWRTWTSRLWQQMLVEGRDERVLLQPLQERLLWEEILDSDPHVERTDALLDLCQSATTLLLQHNVAETWHTDRPGSPATDIARFSRWVRSVHGHCRGEQILPAAALEAALADHAAAIAASHATILRCDLAGLSPAQESLLSALSRHGTTILQATPTDAASTPILLRCADDAAELQALAQHLADALNSATRPNIAVVVADLSSARDRIERTLREHLQPQFAPSTFADDRHPLWEFSTGRPLASTGIIADALHLLTWSVRDLEAEEISLLLRSPHLQWPIDAETAASLDAALLRRNPHLSGTWSARAAARLFEKASPALADALSDRTRSWPGLRHGTASFSALAERARHILHDFGWLRSGERSSTEFQAVKRCESVLDDLAALDLVSTTPPSWPAFVHRLTAAVRATSFARENTGAPIQFLTPDESTGVSADELWVLHADEARWSSHTAPHPLLPRALQQHHAMPGTDPALDQQRQGDAIHRIAHIAANATFSYAHSSEAGEQRPSAFVAALPSIQHRDSTSAGTLAQLHAASDLQTFQDGELIPIQRDGNSRPISGGVSTLQSQAACAFRAFAECRLGSATLDTHDLGMDARDRGSLLHNALQIFWQNTQNSDALHRLIAEDRLTAEIHRSVDLALRAHRDPGDRWSESYLEIQRTRLGALLLRWLLMEAERPRFQIAALEREVSVTVADLALNVRVDRVDRVELPDGGTAHVILDYKTGQPSAKKWEGERPDEPQLPLYATSAMSQLAGTGEAPVAAIAFAVVRAGDKLDFVSAPRKSAWLSRDPRANHASLGTELHLWRQTLESLAQDFSNGIASVGPKEYPATCRFCDQRLLCRLNPALLDAEDASEVDA